MFISYVLRLRPESADRDSLTGEIEAVGSGQRAAVRTVGEILDFVRTTKDGEVLLSRRAREQLDR